jgi:hypothetical protein
VTGAGPAHEATTIMHGGPGVPTIIVRDHDGWVAQVAAEKRAKADAEVKAAVASIERGEHERKYAPRPSLAELADSARAIAALAAERREEPRRVARQLDVTEALITAGLAALPPDPPQPTRHGKPLSTAQVAYEQAQAAWQAKQARQAMAAGCGTCAACRTGGVFPCVRW